MRLEEVQRREPPKRSAWRDRLWADDGRTVAGSGATPRRLLLSSWLFEAEGGVGGGETLALSLSSLLLRFREGLVGLGPKAQDAQVDLGGLPSIRYEGNTPGAPLERGGP